MLSSIKHLVLPSLRRFVRNHSENTRFSFSQCGEDLILQQLFMVLGISKVTYLDIGAHHPTYLSNTYLFYLAGGEGVCIEPDPVLFETFSLKRPRDKSINCGVGVEAGDADFFVMSTSTLNTFSKDEAERYQSYGQHRIIKSIKIRLENINDILANYFNKIPNLISIDVEGLDYLILKSFDFMRFRPAVFCLETLSYTEDKSERKLSEIIELMHENGYMTYADTYINTIFVDKAVWEMRP